MICRRGLLGLIAALPFIRSVQAADHAVVVGIDAGVGDDMTVVQLRNWPVGFSPFQIRAVDLDFVASRSFSAEEIVSGWSSPVARQAHNLKVEGSNPRNHSPVRSMKVEAIYSRCQDGSPLVWFAIESGQIGASPAGISLSGSFPVFDQPDDVVRLKATLECAWSAFEAMKHADDPHAVAQGFVHRFNSRSRTRGEAA